MRGDNSAEQNKLHNTYGMTHCLGEIQNRTQRRGKSTKNCNHNNYERKMILRKRSSVYCNGINPMQHRNQIPQEAGRKSQMPTNRADRQDQSSTSNSNLPFKLQHKCLEMTQVIQEKINLKQLMNQLTVPHEYKKQALLRTETTTIRFRQNLNIYIIKGLINIIWGLEK